MDLPRPELLVDCKPAPNPRRVRIFLAEKGVDLPREQVDIMSGAQFGEHKARVGWHHVPALELQDGRFLTESLAICRYIEALWPEPN
ncbi:MAG: glutathione S-transferase N-terminal domain-containing protein, partial [Rhodobacteraceae bacterium]|nr:glutathione S-transferase N-terminal domain-containing protein [Paracoccaceae bacterium]